LDMRAGRPQLGGRVFVAGDHARRAPGPAGQLRGGDLADVAGVDAERVRLPERARGTLRDGGGPGGAIGMNPACRATPDALDDAPRLRLLRAEWKELDAVGQLVGAWLWGMAIAGLGGEDRLDRLGALEREELVQREGLGDSREAAGHDHD